MMDSLFFMLDADGEPVRTTDVIVWGTWRKNTDPHVALDQVGEVKISTVFLGMDHQFGIGPPVLWETMIFGGVHDQSQWRYTSRAAALEGHAAAVVLVLSAK